MITELKTSGGTVYPVRHETEHYVLCGSPTPSNQTVIDALLEFEDLYIQGYRLCTVHAGGVFLEKIQPTILRDSEAGRGSEDVPGVKQS